MSPAFPELDPNLVARETSMQRLHTVELGVEGLKNALGIVEFETPPLVYPLPQEQMTQPTNFKAAEVAKENSEFETRAREDVDKYFREAA